MANFNRGMTGGVLDLRSPDPAPKDFSSADEHYDPIKAIQSEADYVDQYQQYWNKLDSWDKANDERRKRVTMERTISPDFYEQEDKMLAKRYKHSGDSLETRLERLSRVFQKKVRKF